MSDQLFLEMKSIIDQIKKAAAFNEKECWNEWSTHTDTPPYSVFYCGAKHQHTQNAWAFEALTLAIKTIERELHYECECGAEESDGSEVICYKHEALEKIAALVPKGDKQ